MEQVWFKANDAAKYLGVSRSTFYRLIREGRITVYQIEGTDEKRYRRDQLDSLLTPAPQEGNKG